MSTIFYYEDEEVWRHKYVAVMKARGYHVEAYASNLEAERSIRKDAAWQPPDVAVIDIKDQLKQENVGFRVCKELRYRWPSLPIVFLTSSEHGSADEYEALQMRAHYYIYKVKDPNGLFLLAALESALERNEEGAINSAAPYHRGSLTVIRELQRVEWKGRRVPLAATEFRIVDCLASQAPHPQSYERLRLAGQIQEIRDEDIDFSSEEEKLREKEKQLRNTLHVHIRSIRRKFEIVEGDVQSERGSTPDDGFEFKEILVTERDFGYSWQKDR